MTVSIYAALFMGLIIWLSFKVINIRHDERISLGDGGNADLKNAIAAHQNAIEYIPMGVLLLLMLELSNQSIWLIHLSAILLLIGRLIHARAMLTDSIPLRVRGMQLTILSLILLIVLNLYSYINTTFMS